MSSAERCLGKEEREEREDRDAFRVPLECLYGMYSSRERRVVGRVDVYIGIN